MIIALTIGAVLLAALIILYVFRFRIAMWLGSKATPPQPVIIVTPRHQSIIDVINSVVDFYNNTLTGGKFIMNPTAYKWADDYTIHIAYTYTNVDTEKTSSDYRTFTLTGPEGNLTVTTVGPWHSGVLAIQKDAIKID